MSGPGVRSSAARLTPIQSVPAQPALPSAYRPPAPGAPAPGAPPMRGRRPTWTLIAVAPAASRGVRRFELRRWHVRMAIAGFVALTVLAYFVGSWTVRESYEDQLEAAYGMLSDADLASTAMSDTLRALRIAASLPAATPSTAAAGMAAVAAAAAGSPTAVTPGRAFLPLDGRITSYFARARRHPILGIKRPHDGLDIAAPYGTPIHAPATGRVVRVERSLGYGLVVEVNHGRGIHTWYAHLRTAKVKVGDRVNPDAIIATVGSSGLSTGPHLHYEVRVNGKRVDPMQYRW